MHSKFKIARITAVQNLYLASGKTITLDNPTTANIGITTQTTPTESEPIEISVVNETDYSSIFVADDSDNYIVKYNSNKKIVLDVKKPEIRFSVSFNANGGRGEMDTVYVSPSNNQFQLPTCTLKPPAKKEFDGWSTSPVGVKIKTPSIEITHDVNLYAVWKDHVHEITTMNLENEMKKESCKCGYYVIRYK